MKHGDLYIHDDVKEKENNGLYMIVDVLWEDTLNPHYKNEKIAVLRLSDTSTKSSKYSVGLCGPLWFTREGIEKDGLRPTGINIANVLKNIKL